MNYDPNHPLHRLAFEWHDLPVARISIVENGVVIDVLPYEEAARLDERATLSLLDAESIEFDFGGPWSLKGSTDFMIMDFDVIETSPGRISGTLGIILNWSKGYWRIHVTDAAWQVTEPASSAPQSSANDA